MEREPTHNYRAIEDLKGEYEDTIELSKALELADEEADNEEGLE